MDGLSTSPRAPGAGHGELSPQDFEKKYFELFPAGTRREVLLLGDLILQPVHWSKSKRRKVLCSSIYGVPCRLCEIAAESDDIGIRQTEHISPTFVRAGSEREFHQKACIFSAASGASIRKLFPEGAMRGKRVEVHAKKHGTSTRYEIKALPGLPHDFPAVLPEAFALEPFIRGRFGKPQVPGQGPLILPSFRCTAVGTSPAGMPKSLNLSSADFAQTPEEVARMKEILAKAKEKFEPPAAATSFAPPPVPAAVVESAEAIPAPAPASSPATAAAVKPDMYQAAHRRAEGIAARLARAKGEDAERIRALKEVPAEDLTAREAVQAHRIFDFVLGTDERPATVPDPSSNGHGKTGGAV